MLVGKGVWFLNTGMRIIPAPGIAITALRSVACRYYKLRGWQRADGFGSLISLKQRSRTYITAGNFPAASF